MKRILTIVMSTAILLSLLAGLSAGAGAPESEGQCGENVFYTFNESSAMLTLSGSGAMYDYGDGENSPFCGDCAIKSVAVQEGVTSIGDAAFEGCSTLESVTLPSTLSAIGTRAFADCTQLQSVTIPANEVTFGSEAFAGQCVLHCHYASSAYTYAREQGMAYVLTDSIAATGFSATLSGSKFAYTGKAIKPLVTLKNEKGKQIGSQYYSVTYDATPGTVGKHAVKVKCLEPYTGTKTCYYYVTPTVNKPSSLTVGSKYQLKVYGYDKVNKKDVSFIGASKFTSSNTKLATVSKSGVITALVSGKVTISVDTGGFVYKFTLSLTAPPIATNTQKQGASTTKNGVPSGAQYTYIELTNYSGSTEGKYFFGRKIIASKQSLKFSAYSFKSANTKIVKVDANGRMTAAGKAGTTTITVGAKYGGKVYTKKVYVYIKKTAAAPYYYKQGNYSNVIYDNPKTSGKETIASSGCGVCATAMVVNNLAGKKLCTVESLARFAVANGARDNSGTNLYTLLNAICKANSHFSYTVTGDKNALLKHLKSGGLAIINQGDKYSVFCSVGHYVVAYKQAGGNIEVFDPSMSANKYKSSNRVVARTTRGCIVPIAQVVKATQDRNPGYYLITYHKKPLNNSPIRALDAKPKSTTKNYSSPLTMYCNTTGGLRFRKSPSTSAGLVAGAGGGASVIGYRDAVKVLAVVSNGEGKWYKIQYRGYTGYAYASYLQSSRPGVKTITIPKGRHLRAGVGTSAKILTTTKKAYKAEVLVNSYWNSGGYMWSRIKIGSKKYYVAMV